jgi:hypothetical protein
MPPVLEESIDICQKHETGKAQELANEIIYIRSVKQYTWMMEHRITFPKSKSNDEHRIPSRASDLHCLGSWKIQPIIMKVFHISKRKG